MRTMFILTIGLAAGVWAALAVEIMVNPIFQAAEQGDLKLAKMLLEKDPDLVKAKGSAGYTPLHWASGAGQTRTVEILLVHGADVNARDDSGATPLHLAAFNGHLKVLEMLIAKGADVNIRNVRLRIPLHNAAGKGFDEIVAKLLRAKSDVNARDNMGMTSLHAAAMYGRCKVIELLAKNGANLNERDNSGNPALSIAIQFEQYDAVELLVRTLGSGATTETRAKSAALDIKNDLGLTPLHLAAMKGQDKTVALLLSSGASASAVDNHGQTALQWAELKGYKNVAEMLRQGTKKAE